jgi:hypothetical protein
MMDFCGTVFTTNPTNHIPNCLCGCASMHTGYILVPAPPFGCLDGASGLGSPHPTKVQVMVRR